MNDINEADDEQTQRLSHCYPTPPWVAEDLGEEFFLRTNHRWGIGASSHPTYRIAKVEGSGPVAEATARLMQSAPALLTGCEVALAVFRRLGMSEDPEARLLQDIVNEAAG